jgi:hypothetical protein
MSAITTFGVIWPLWFVCWTSKGGALIGDRPGEIFRKFRDYISHLLNTTITDAPLHLVHRKDAPYAHFAFRDEQDIAMAAPLFLDGLFLAVSQDLEVEQLADKTWRLHTVEYSYHLLEDSSFDSRWIVRWEYKSHRRLRNKHPRNHVHIDTVVETPAGPMNLDKLHLPTGWVTIEEVIRFLIAELGVPPKTGNWDDELVESERFFKTWTSRII